MVHKYTNNSFPDVSDQNEYLTITYYDDYDFVDNGLLTSQGETFTYQSTEGYQDEYNPAVIGQMTGSKTKVLETQDWIHTVNYYDTRYRPIQSVSYNEYQQVLDRMYTSYNFIGEVLKTKSEKSLEADDQQTISRSFDLDHMGRVKSVDHAVSQQVVWTEFENTEVNVNGELVVKNGFTTGKARSQQVLGPYEDGTITYVVTELNNGKDFTLSEDIDQLGDYFNFYNSLNRAYIRHIGQIDASLLNLSIGDEFKITRKGDQLMFYYNGEFKRSYTTDNSKPFFVAMHLKEADSKVESMEIAVEKNMVENTYNELSELIRKDLHVTDEPFQSVDYEYNIRGWLKKVNEHKSLSDVVASNDDFFAMELNYAEGVEAIPLVEQQVTLNPTDDAYIELETPTTNYGTRDYMPVQTYPAYPRTRESFVKFDVSSVDKIKTATFRIYSHARGGANPRDIVLYEVSDDSWQEGTITWSTQPTTGAEITRFVHDDAEVWFEVDITDYVKAQHVEDGFVSFAMRNPIISHTNFRTKEEAGFEPQLVISWDESQPVGVSESALDSTQIYPTDDAYVRQEYPDDNYGSQKIVPVAWNDGGSNHRNSYFRFDVSGVDNVYSAKFHIYSHVRSGHPPNEFSLYAVSNDNWDEETITYNNAPAASSAIITIPYDQPEMWYEIDISDYVKDEFIEDGIVTFMMHHEDAEVLNFRSKEQGGKEPYLMIKSLNENYTAPDMSAIQTRYNGNISSIIWKGHDDKNASLSTYAYDGLNRLKSASYYQGVFDQNVFDRKEFTQGLFDVKNISYDLNGNIESLTRNMNSLVGAKTMDNLTYRYDEGNKLLNVLDEVTIDAGFIDGTNGGDDYDYDDNGNLIQDLNKDIVSIEYNHLNLPKKVEKGDGKYIEYIYDAAGMKLQQIVHDTEITTTDYLGEFIYKNNTLELIQHEEGRIVPSPFTGELVYQYHLKDHLGNVRTTFTTAPNTITFINNYEDDPAVPDDSELFTLDESQYISSVDLFDHTDFEGTTYTNSRLMTGAEGNRVGSAITFTVGKGDIITAEVFGKYEEVTTNPNQILTTIGSTIINALLTEGAYLGEFGGGTSSGAADAADGLIAAAHNDGNFDPQGILGFINMLFISEDGTITKFAYDQISGGQQAIGNPTKTPHDQLSIEDFTAPANGAIIVYLSNEHDNQTNIYFDDLNITINEHPVIQSEDYYPFGLTFNSYQRVTSKQNDYLYNGKELQDELDLNWLDYGARMYDPAIGRWGVLDPMADQRDWLSPYQYVQNNPIIRVDPTGMIDDYYGIVNDELVFLGSDGQGNNVRLVNEGQHETAVANLNGENTTDAQRQTLRGGGEGEAAQEGISQVVTFNEGSVQAELQGASDRTISSGLENSAIITLDPATATVDAQAGAQGTNTNVTNTVNTYGSDGQWTGDGSRLIIGIAHGHPTTQTPGQVNTPGYSADDSQTAGSSISPTYSIDSYNSTVGGSATIHQARPGGTSGTNPVGTTQNTNNIGRRSFINTAKPYQQ